MPSARRGVRFVACAAGQARTLAIPRGSGRRSPRGSRPTCTESRHSKRGASPDSGFGAVTAGEPSRLGGAIQAATDLFRLTRPGIASGHERREKTIWEVTSDAGLRAVVVNWWATWPAEPGGNIILSDRATLRLEHGGPLDAEIAPASVYERLGPRWPVIRQEAAELAAEALGPLSQSVMGVRTVAQRSAELDAMQLALGREVSTPAPDLFAVYLPGLDIAQHALLGGQDGARPPRSVIATRLDALNEYYVFLDRLLASSIATSANEVVVLVGEPGRTTAAADGWLGVSGPVAAARAEIAGRSTDVMPTVLHLLGVPISDELSGRPLTGLFAEQFVARYPVRQVTATDAPLPAQRHAPDSRSIRK